MAEAEVVRLFQEPATIDVFDPGTERSPKNAQAEKTVIGTLLARNKALDSVVDFLVPGHFSDLRLGSIYDETRRRLVAGQSVDVMTLAEWVSADPSFGGDQRKSTQYLSTLLKDAVSIDIRGYGKSIESCAVRRDLVAAAHKILTVARNPRANVTAEIAKLTAELDGASLGADKQRISTFDDALDSAVQEAAEAHARGSPGGLPLTGWPRLDRSLVMKPKEITVLGGRPGSGKSGLGWQIALGMAREFRDSGRPIKETGGILGFSLEMSKEALATRAISAASGVDAWSILRGETTASQMERVNAAREELRGLPLELLDINGLTKEQIRTLMFRQKLHWGKIALTIIDHCHLVDLGDYGEHHGQASGMTTVANAVLDWAKSFDTHVLALVQLRIKSMIDRKDHRPALGDIHSTSSFDNNAQNIVFLHREIQWMPAVPPAMEPAEDGYAYQQRRQTWMDKREQAENEAEAIIAKVRSGPAGHVIKLFFDGKTTSFSEKPGEPI